MIKLLHIVQVGNDDSVDVDGDDNNDKSCCRWL